MLTIGDAFPQFELTACVSLDPRRRSRRSTTRPTRASGRSCFFWPKDFTFVCPTEIAAFGKLNGEFADRDAQVLGVSVDIEFVHHAWRKDHPDLRDLPFPMLVGHQARAVARRSASSTRTASRSAPPSSSTRNT